MNKGRFQISGSTLKLIAIVIMLIDHIGAVVVAKMLTNGDFLALVLNGQKGQLLQSLVESGELYTIYNGLRIVGRAAFPIFCFLLIEGFRYTKDKKKYAFRLGIFAVISEIPFNLAIAGSVFDFGYQNVFFTLLAGFLLIMTIEKIQALRETDQFLLLPIKKTEEVQKKLVASLLAVIVTVVAIGVVELCNTDYASYGVISILVLYLFQQKKWLQIFCGSLSFAWEPAAIFGFLPIALYNGKRGWNIKYLFYAFYPIHLLVLYGVAVLLGAA